MRLSLTRLLTVSCFLLSTGILHAVNVEWKTSSEYHEWRNCHDYVITPFERDVVYDVMVTKYKDQQILGFGGCFAELGWDALQQLNDTSKKEVLRRLFDPQYGLRFSFCRVPIGANDFARDWYSYDEHPGDFKLKHFSIAHDKNGLIPYIKSALVMNPALRLWACPWSPPVWMKTNASYASRSQLETVDNTGNRLQLNQFNQDCRYMKTYARYLSKYLVAYKKQGINISMLMFQNEPYTWNIWPNCLWTPQAISTFVGRYLGPELRKHNDHVGLWHGTLNCSDMNHFETVYTDSVASKYFTGAGFQWEGKELISKVHKKYPNLALMCTENECGNGSNDWGAAEHTFNLLKAYIGGGANTFMYFNMILMDDCMSSWGWKQNALVVVDSKTGKAIFTPEYYLMQHLSHYVDIGAYRLQTLGHDDSVLTFKNPNGEIVILVANQDNSPHKVSIAVLQDVLNVKLPPKSFNTLVIK